MDSIKRSLSYLLFTALALAALSAAGFSQMQPNAPSQPAMARQVGTVKSIEGNTVTVKTDAGSDIKVTVQDSTRILRVAPGQKDLQDAVPLQLSDLQVGDRVLARGAQADDTQPLTAAAIIVMKQGDVAEKQQHEREDWQKHGVGGIITALDAANGTIAISVVPSYNITIKTSKDTRFLRYAPDSVKFNDAKAGTFNQIKAGDQLRARGTRSEDGKEFAASEVISGSFRNIAGTILSIDAAKNTISVMDVFKKQPVTVKFTSDSQLHKLPLPLAQRMALALKAHPAETSAQGGAAAQVGPSSSAGSQQAVSPRAVSKPGAAATVPPGPQAGQPRAEGGQGPRAGAPDVQQFLGRLPTVALADLQKGDAVMLVSAEGTESSEVKAITMLTGVEPILTASPTNSATAAILSAWNMSGGGEGASQ